MVRAFIWGGAMVAPGLRARLSQGSSFPPPWQPQTEECGGLSWPVGFVAEELLADGAREPRLRRAAKVARLASAAARDAIADAGLSDHEAARMPVVFLTSDGAVSHTARFFGGVARGGTHAGSPILFPETVYNAPASHAAALLGTEKESLTLVGDASAAATAIHAACLLAAESPHVLVLAANEATALSCAGYSHWGFLRTPLSLRGHILSDGAAALVLSLQAPSHSTWRIQAAFTPDLCRSRTHMQRQLGAILRQCNVQPPCPTLPACCHTAFEQAELAAIHEAQTYPAPHDPKDLFGESLAASPLIATVAWAGGFLQKEPGEVMISAVGFWGGVAALRLTKGERSD